VTKLKQLRKQSGLSQAELAAAIGVTQGAVSQWEMGSSKPSLGNLVSIAKALGCKVDDLIDN
jgi:transcriptional regulator with XRE-family HTH domain